MVMATVAIDHSASIPVNIANNLAYLRKVHGYDNQNVNNGTVTAKRLIGDALRKRVEGINHEFCEPGEEDTFFVADVGEVYRQHMRWKLNLPRVKPFYAVKCNPDPVILRLLALLGTGFDCASKAEIEQVLDGLGPAGFVDPSRVIYAQPCKTASYVRFVAARGVRQMTFDNGDELRKIARLFPDAELLLRISTDDSSSLCRLSQKFGASLGDADALLALAVELGLNVVGVSFHVGSGASDPEAFVRAVRDAAVVFAAARYRHGFAPRLLDVGGGFLADESFELMAAALNAALDEYFPAGSGVAVIAEPGRYYVSRAFTLACNVIARRTVVEPVAAAETATAAENEPMIFEATPNSSCSTLVSTAGAASPAATAAPTPTTTTSYMLYVNDGLYGNFSSIMFDHQHPEAKVLRAAGRMLYNTAEAEQVPAAEAASATAYSIWGPTCDGIDRIAERACFAIAGGDEDSLPAASTGKALDVGDWLYFEDMGAYTRCSATRFNGFSDNHDIVYVCSEVGAKAVLGMK